mgnify:CR=1 FL=1
MIQNNVINSTSEVRTELSIIQVKGKAIEAVQLVVDSEKGALAQAIEAGYWLLAVKNSLKNDNSFKKFIVEHTKCSVRVAKRYIHLYEHRAIANECSSQREAEKKISAAHGTTRPPKSKPATPGKEPDKSTIEAEAVGASLEQAYEAIGSLKRGHDPKQEGRVFVPLQEVRRILKEFMKQHNLCPNVK